MTTDKIFVEKTKIDHKDVYIVYAATAKDNRKKANVLIFFQSPDKPVSTPCLLITVSARPLMAKTEILNEKWEDLVANRADLVFKALRIEQASDLIIEPIEFSADNTRTVGTTWYKAKRRDASASAWIQLWKEQYQSSESESKSTETEYEIGVSLKTVDEDDIDFARRPSYEIITSFQVNESGLEIKESQKILRPKDRTVGF